MCSFGERLLLLRAALVAELLLVLLLLLPQFGLETAAADGVFLQYYLRMRHEAFANNTSDLRMIYLRICSVFTYGNLPHRSADRRLHQQRFRNCDLKPTSSSWLVLYSTE